MVVGLFGGTFSAAVLSSGTASAAITSVPCTGPSGGEAGLKSAINAANSSGGGIINLAAGCTYTLTAVANDPSTGLPEITSKIIINGSNTTITRSAVAPDFRILLVDVSGNLALNNLSITNGKLDSSWGGGIRNNGTLTLSNTTVSDNTASDSGGGIASVGVGVASLSIINSRVSDNSASNDGGIMNFSSMTIANSQISGNTTTSGGAGLQNQPGGKAQITSSQITDNTAGGFGGGIDNSCAASMTVTSSRVSGNTAARGGGVFNSLCGLFPGGGSLTLVTTQVTGNTANSSVAANGGGIDNYGSLVLSNSPVTGNVAVGQPAGTAHGGGIGNETGATAQLTNSPVLSNKATGTGATGGGIFNTGAVTLTNSPVASNRPDNCGSPSTVAGCSG